MEIKYFCNWKIENSFFNVSYLDEYDEVDERELLKLLTLSELGVKTFDLERSL